MKKKEAPKSKQIPGKSLSRDYTKPGKTAYQRVPKRLK